MIEHNLNDWEEHEVLDYVDTATYEAVVTTEQDGVVYIATGTFVHNELVQVADIEELL